MADGVRQAGADPIVLPLADGGEGTLWALHRARGGSWLAVETVNPWGRRITAALLHWPRDSTVVVELAQAAGWATAHRRQRAPLTASTYGVGLLLRAALDTGAARVMVALGGSLTTDAGSGLMSALGVRFLDARGQVLPPGGAALADLESIDWSGLDRRLGSVQLVALTDVDNPLTGVDGAARTFARQKGASADDVEILELALCRFQEVAGGAHVASGSGTGAAGGSGAALKLLGATVTPGSRSIMELIDFVGQLTLAQALITGEGRFDHQSLHGKAPAVALAAAQAAAKPSCLIVGKRSFELHEEDAATFVLDLAPPQMALPEVRRQIQGLFRQRAEQATRWLLASAG